MLIKIINISLAIIKILIYLFYFYFFNFNKKTKWPVFPFPPPQPTPPQLVSLNGNSYSASRLNNTVTFDSIPPAGPFAGNPQPIPCNLQSTNMVCGSGMNTETLTNCQINQITGTNGSQVVCQADPNAPIKIFAQVPVTPINSVYVNTSWLWIIIILIILYLLFVLYKKR